MRVEINSLLSSILAFKKNSNSTQFIGLCFGFSEQIIPLQTIGVQVLAPATSACHPMIWQSFLKASPEDKIEGLDCKINGQAFGAVLQHSFKLGLSDCQAQTQGVS